MSAKRLHESLFCINASIYRECAEGPFISGLADGSLPEDVFRAYLAQDALFLKDFIVAVANGIKSCANQPHVVAALADLIVGGVGELESVERDAVGAGVDLNQIQRAPATARFADFLNSQAKSGSEIRCLAAFSPCIELYSYIGRTMAADNRVVTTNPHYKNWFAKYASEEMQALAETWQGHLDAVGRDTPEVQQIYHDALLNERDFFLSFLE